MEIVHHDRPVNQIKILGRERQMKIHLTALAFLLPSLFFLVLFIYWPLVQTFSLGFLSWNMVSPNKEWVGIDNYTILLQSPEFGRAAWNTLKYVLILLILNLVLPYFSAFALSYGIKRFQEFYRSLLFLPSMLSMAVASMIFFFFFNPLGGPIGEVLKQLGTHPIDVLRSSDWVIPAVATIAAWRTFGQHFILILSGMLNVPKELIEAAQLDGMGKMGIFCQVVFPLCSPTTLYVGTLTVVMGLQSIFVPIQMLTNGGPDQGSTNLIYYVYQTAFQFFHTGRAAACAIILTLVFAGLIALQNAIAEKMVHYEN